MSCKQVCYAYPTSQIAVEHSAEMTGCWCVMTGPGSWTPWPQTIVNVYTSQWAAINAAYEIDLPWGNCWLHNVKKQMAYDLRKTRAGLSA